MLLTVLGIVQLVLSVLLIVVVLVQQKGAGLGAGFGSGGGGIQSSRRGVDKTLHTITIVTSLLFFAISIAIIILG